MYNGELVCFPLDSAGDSPVFPADCSLIPFSSEQNDSGYELTCLTDISKNVTNDTINGYTTIDATNGNTSDDQCDDDFVEFSDVNELPPSIASCYIINKAYQDALEMFKEELERKLLENRAMQEELLNSEQLTNEHIYPNSFLKFLAPYFRDNKGFKPNDNEDTKSRKSAGCINFLYQRTRKPWNEQDKKHLKSTVESYVLKQNLEPLTMKENTLLMEIGLLQTCDDDSDLLNLKMNELESVRNDINDMSSIPASIFLPSLDKSYEIDWLWVSSRCSSIYSEFDCEIKWTNDLHPEINHGKWSPEEEAKLKNICQNGHQDWELVAQNLGTSRKAWQCFEKYQSSFNESIVRSGSFSHEESTLLLKLVNDLSIGDFIPWHQVTYFMKQRSLAQIKYYWNKIHCSRRGAKWTELEDKVLLAAVEKLGPRNWKHVAKFIPGRSNRQCRERYMMRLGIKDRKLADWTFNEDLKLIQIAPNLKFRWIEMVAHILRRNARQIAARYDTIEKYRIANDLRSSKDLQDLVPRKKSSKCQKFIISELQLNPGQSIDDFLREGRKELEINVKNSNYKPKIPRLGSGGRPKKAEKEEAIEQELVLRFAFYSLIGKLNQQAKRLDRTSQEAMILEVLYSILLDYFSGEIDIDEPHLLHQVTSLVLKKHIIGVNVPKLVYCPPIFPPNSVTTNSYQCLLFMKQHLAKQLKGKVIDTSQHEWHPNYRALLKFLVSIYYWPCLLSTQPPQSTQAPAKSQQPTQFTNQDSQSSTPSASSPSAFLPSKKKNTKRRKKSQPHNIDFLNEAREKQRYIFMSYQKHTLSESRSADPN